MKELSIEQKAQRYDAAVELAAKFKKEYLNYKELNVHRGVIEAFNDIFPELKESEDERIRKALIKYLDALDDDEIRYGVSFKDMRTWLEKQGEQKPVFEMKTPEESLGISSKEYNEIVNDCLYDESKPTDKVEPKFHKGDWVVVSTTKGDRLVQIASVEYFKDGYPSYTTTEGRWFGNGTKARLLTDKDVETITLPESKIIVSQKPAWSEEDERNLNDAILFIETGTYSLDKDNLINWLKSIRPQNRWKPSEEEMKVLEYSTRLFSDTERGNYYSGVLEDLYEELKKLREE